MKTSLNSIGGRTRFAPSPTGYLHVGGARTALFNWLWARKHGAHFILRVEDTDVERNQEDSVQAIFDGLKWLGLNWDEGPFFQSKRIPIYNEHYLNLISKGLAYRCYSTDEEIEASRKAFTDAGKKGFQFRSPWRDKTDELDKPFVVRYKNNLKDQLVFTDHTFGDMKKNPKELGDFVLVRSNGLPMYNFACAVDDALMDINFVIRGRDHLENTFAQKVLLEGLDLKVPEYAHLPMMMKNKSEKLSKRNGDVSVLDNYRDKGWHPEGLLSYLARFGWSHNDQELFKLEDLIKLYDISVKNKADGIYDGQKCESINKKFIKQFESSNRLMSLVGLNETVEFHKKAIELSRGQSNDMLELKKLSDNILSLDCGVSNTENLQYLKDNKTLFDAVFSVVSNPLTTKETLLNWLTENKEVGTVFRVVLCGVKLGPNNQKLLECFDIMRIKIKFDCCKAML
mgnify:CR=1 FL=1